MRLSPVRKATLDTPIIRLDVATRGKTDGFHFLIREIKAQFTVDRTIWAASVPLTYVRLPYTPATRSQPRSTAVHLGKNTCAAGKSLPHAPARALGPGFCDRPTTARKPSQAKTTLPEKPKDLRAKTLDITAPTPNIQKQVGLFDEFTRKQFNRRL